MVITLLKEFMASSTRASLIFLKLLTTTDVSVVRTFTLVPLVPLVPLVAFTAKTKPRRGRVMSKLSIKKFLAFPFKLLATILGIAMMICIFIAAMINNPSINELTRKVDLIMDKLESLYKKDGE